MGNDFSIHIEGAGALLAMLGAMENIDNEPELRQGILDGAMIIESNAKKNLDDMVYSKPERRYKRKKSAGLFGATQATGRVNPETNGVSTGVAVNKEYAVYVHMGTGIYAVDGNGRKTPWIYKDEDGQFHRTVGQVPKPFLTKALKDSEEGVVDVMFDATNRLIERKLK